MNDQERPAPVIVDSWREENPLGSFSKEAGTGVKRVSRRSRVVGIVGIAALGALSLSVTALLNSLVAPAPTPRVQSPANRAAVSSPPPAQVESTGPQTEVSIESVDVPASSQNQRAVEPLPTTFIVPPGRAEHTVAAIADNGDGVRVPIPNEERSPAREAVADVPAPIGETLIGTWTVGEPAPIAIAPPRVADARPAIAAATTPPATIPTGRSAVAAVLQRYAAAFSSLDVGEVKAVWPDVNEGALTRAFSTLQDQRFDLGECDIWVTGASAVASCAGRASYTPKIGTRKARSEAREWTFYLHQDGPLWSIGTVKTR